MNSPDTSLCACMGPQGADEFCPCVMIKLGLKSDDDYKPTEEEQARMKNVLSEIFGWNNK